MDILNVAFSNSGKHIFVYKPVSEINFIFFQRSQYFLYARDIGSNRNQNSLKFIVFEYHSTKLLFQKNHCTFI